MTLVALTEIAASIVEKTIRQLPIELREFARNLPVHFEAQPAADVVAEFEPDILGLFTGCPHGQELTHDNPAPPQILLYLESLWEFSEEDESVYRAEVRLTYLHELGHYFGWDEDELAARGLD